MDQITKKYIDFFIPDDGLARTHAMHLYQKLVKYNSLKILLAMSLDGCSFNTGVDSGMYIYLILLILIKNYNH